MQIDFKLTQWERFEVSEDFADEVLAKIKSGEISNGIQLADAYPSLDWNTILETEEYMNPEQNDGDSTIEVLKDHETVWTNVE